MNEPTLARMNEFMTVALVNQRRLYQYIFSLLGNPHDAEDVLQEALLVLWAKFDQYQPGTNFFAWACRVAHYEVLSLRRQRQSRPVMLDDDVLALIAEESLEMADLLNGRHSALASCLEKLRPADRKLISRRYTAGMRRDELASELGRPANSISKSLGRIRHSLWLCITQATEQEEERCAP